jgi:putative SOS response-associated peptidase YedK
MCCRFRLSVTARELARMFNVELNEALDEFDNLSRINIAPTQQIITVKQGSKKSRKLTMMRWGLIPAWTKDANIGNRNFNARSENIRETASFRDLISSRRCLIPADGFYEWKKTGKIKQPYCFEVGKKKLFAFAGLWDSWKNPQGQIVESCTILTTSPNEVVASIHERMPVIVPPEKYDVWLDPDINDYQAIKEILTPYDAQAMSQYPVSPKLNNSANEELSLDCPIEDRPIKDRSKPAPLPEQPRLF